MDNLATGTFLRHGAYRIERMLGQGGFGITYLATDLSLDRLVAIKEFFPADYCGREGDTNTVTVNTGRAAGIVARQKAKFLKEARNIAKLKHDSIIKIHAAFEENNTAYYVMDYIDGAPLSQLVKSTGGLPDSEVLHYMRQVGAALSYLHGCNMCHLDIKPANIMVDKEGRAILIDFGLSKQYDTVGRQTSTTPTAVSHGYAPLEQYTHNGLSEFSPETDIYSLGATLYNLLGGITPPNADTVNDEGLVFPAKIPARYQDIIEKAMQPRRKDRYATVDDFMADLNGAGGYNNGNGGTRPVPRPAPRPNPRLTPKSEPAPRPKSKAKYFWTALVIILGLGAAGYWWYSMQDKAGPVNKEGERDMPKPVASPFDANGHDYVDLGLPSGLKWATCNIGASRASDYGDYFAWGETTPKSSYTESNSKMYGKSLLDLKEQGIVDKNGNLNPAYDAARQTWGGSWRMPTKADFQELINSCTWTWTSLNGHNGYQVTGPNGNYIFLPAAGYRGGSTLDNEDTYGNYWSSTAYDDSSYAYYLYFGKDGRNLSGGYRRYGRSLRPVSE